MDRNRMLVGLAVAIVIALFASRYVYQQVRRTSTVAVAPKFSPVVVAAVPLGLGARLKASDLRVLNWPLAQQPAGSFSRIDDCVDRALITPVVANEVILDQKLARREAGAGLPAAIPEGMRAVSIRVDDVVAVAGFVQPGTMVDVMVTGDPSLTGAPGISITRTFLEDIRVLASGQQVQQDATGKPQTATVVTLLVTPEQANLLALASTQGKIHLALRNTIDTKEVNPAAAYTSSLFLHAPQPAVTQKRAPAPRPVPSSAPAPYVMEVIRGDKLESQTFPSKTGP
jgi:pilus assembly protein CpaB